MLAQRENPRLPSDYPWETISVVQRLPGGLRVRYHHSFGTHDIVDASDTLIERDILDRQDAIMRAGAPRRNPDLTQTEKEALASLFFKPIGEWPAVVAQYPNIRNRVMETLEDTAQSHPQTSRRWAAEQAIEAIGSPRTNPHPLEWAAVAHNTAMLALSHGEPEEADRILREAAGRLNSEGSDVVACNMLDALDSSLPPVTRCNNAASILHAWIISKGLDPESVWIRGLARRNAPAALVKEYRKFNKRSPDSEMDVVFPDVPKRLRSTSDIHAVTYRSKKWTPPDDDPHRCPEDGCHVKMKKQGNQYLCPTHGDPFDNVDADGTPKDGRWVYEKDYGDTRPRWYMNYRHEWQRNRLQHVPGEKRGSPPWLLGRIKVLPEGLDDYGSPQNSKTRTVHEPRDGLVLIGSAVEYETVNGGKVRTHRDLPLSWAFYTDCKGLCLYIIDRDVRP